MKTGPSLLSIALLLALAACSKQPQDAAPSSTPTPASALGTPASDSSLPSASASWMRLGRHSTHRHPLRRGCCHPRRPRRRVCP